MTIDQAIRILDPETTAEALGEIEYYGGLRGREGMSAACEEACRIAVGIMQKYQEENKDSDLIQLQSTALFSMEVWR